MSDQIDFTALEAGVKLYRHEHDANQIVDMCVAHALNESGEPDEYNVRRWAHDVAVLATTTLLQRLYTNDWEIRRLREERDHYKRVAEESLLYTPLRTIISEPSEPSK
jgi:hypothetical protein